MSCIANGRPRLPIGRAGWKPLALLPVVLAFATLGCGGERTARPPEPSEPAIDARSAARLLPGPDFELLGLDGELHRLSDHRGRVVLLNFWATWCASCRSEIPELNQLRQEIPTGELAILGIATDNEGPAIVRPYAEELAMAYSVLLDPEAVSTRMFGGLEGYPMTFILDREGLIYSSYLGAQEKQTFLEDVLYLLQAPPSEGEALPPGARPDVGSPS